MSDTTSMFFINSMTYDGLALCFLTKEEALQYADESDIVERDGCPIDVAINVTNICRRLLQIRVKTPDDVIKSS